MSCLSVVGYGKREERCAGGGTQIPNWFVAVGGEASSFSWGESGVFDPESEVAIGAN
jgi:hypothetical protein